MGGGGLKELLPGHINSFPHHPNPPPSPQHFFPAPPQASTAPPSPRGECVCAERVSVGGGGAGVFNNAAFKCCLFAHF